MQTRRFLAALGATLICAALPASRAFAQRREDQGEYQILQARYGTAARNIDVTDRLKQLARRDRPRVRTGTRVLSEKSKRLSPAVYAKRRPPRNRWPIWTRRLSSSY